MPLVRTLASRNDSPYPTVMYSVTEELQAAKPWFPKSWRLGSTQLKRLKRLLPRARTPESSAGRDGEMMEATHGAIFQWRISGSTPNLSAKGNMANIWSNVFFDLIVLCNCSYLMTTCQCLLSGKQMQRNIGFSNNKAVYIHQINRSEFVGM